MSDDRGTEFLKAIYDLIPDELRNLKLGFQFIWTFDILYKGFIQSIVWGHLRKALPPETKIPLSTSADGNTRQANLQDRHKAAVDNCEKALRILALAPTEIGLSMVEEFADHITRAEGVRSEWDKFLYQVRSQVWPELRELEERKRVREQWIKLVEDAELINQQLGTDRL